MAPDADVTLGEIARGLVSLEGRVNGGLVSLEGRVNEKFDAMNRRLDKLEYVPRGEHDLQVKELDDRIAVLEEDKKWTRRTLVASFLYPVLVAAVVALLVLK